MKTLVVLDEALIGILLDAVDFGAVNMGEETELLTEAVRQLQTARKMLEQARVEDEKRKETAEK